MLVAVHSNEYVWKAKISANITAASPCPLHLSYKSSRTIEAMCMSKGKYLTFSSHVYSQTIQLYSLSSS